MNQRKQKAVVLLCRARIEPFVRAINVGTDQEVLVLQCVAAIELRCTANVPIYASHDIVCVLWVFSAGVCRHTVLAMNEHRRRASYGKSSIASAGGVTWIRALSD